MNSIFNSETLLHVWPFLCLAVILIFAILTLRFLWNNGGKRKSNRNHVVILFLFATSSMMGCEKNAPQIDKSVKLSNTASNIESNYFDTHEINESDFGKSIIKFETVDQANKYYAEVERTMAGESTGESIPKLALASANEPLFSAWYRGDSLQYRTTRSIEPVEPTANFSVCLYAYCTDYYILGTGVYLGENCTYGYEACGGEGNTGSGGNNNGGSIPGGSGPNSSGSSGTGGGGLRNGTGTVIAHTAFPRYTAYTKIEFQVSLRNCGLTGVTGSLTGFNLGANYIQGTPQVISNVNSVITIMIPYNISINAVIQGVGTAHTFNGNVAEIRINCLTGVATILL